MIKILTKSTSGGPIESFTYIDKAARLLTTQELVAGCSSLSSVGSFTTGELDGCNYLMENVGRYETTSGTYGYRLESPAGWNGTTSIWIIVVSNRYVYYGSENYASNVGVRPAIIVAKTNIEY